MFIQVLVVDFPTRLNVSQDHQNAYRHAYHQVAAELGKLNCKHVNHIVLNIKYICISVCPKYEVYSLYITFPLKE